MNIKTKDKIKLILSVYGTINLFSSYKKRTSLLFRPFDAPRYIEFAYLEKFLNQKKLNNMKVLDVSSPYIMSYILSKNNTVVKTDIDQSEKKFIEENKNLIFKIEDATNLSFADSTFDLVYSVSVIEHIYEKYVKAIQEMIRVTKKGGYTYITFPVAKEYIEEWSDGSVYEKQHKENNRTFFQYRFDQKHVDIMLSAIAEENVDIIHCDIFWERKDGAYNELISVIKAKKKNVYMNFVKDVIANFYYGFTLFRESSSSDFIKATSCGNMHIVIKKR